MQPGGHRRGRRQSCCQRMLHANAPGFELDAEILRCGRGAGLRPGDTIGWVAQAPSPNDKAPIQKAPFQSALIGTNVLQLGSAPASSVSRLTRFTSVNGTLATVA